ncbi:MAG: SPFH domain-containing protein [Candidatus Limnocylindria bacterium]
MTDRRAPTISGWLMLPVIVALVVIGVFLIVAGVDGDDPVVEWILAAVLLVAAVVLSTGFVINEPNVVRVATILGRYVGTVHRAGFSWTWPLILREAISLRIRNFESQILKVNDAVGNPIEVAAVVVWRVVDPARAAFDVDDFEDYVKIQTETAVRHMASLYPYDSYGEGALSLRANADEVMASLQGELQEQMLPIGIEVIRTQLRRLAYAPEIAADMLRRQQADAVVAARTRIVEGAVGMVDHALEMLSEKGIVQLDEERKAAMVSNLLVVLCSEHHAQPVVNAGSLYT